MFARAILICISILLGACAPELPRAEAGVLDLRGGRSHLLLERPLPLDGEWEFFWNEFLHASPEGPGATPTPELIQVPLSWTRAGFPAEGFASYRLKLLLDEPMDGMAFRIRDTAVSNRFYLNGKLLFNEGIPGRTAETTTLAPVGLLPIPARLERENEIVLEIASFNFHEGGIRKNIRLGTEQRLQNGRAWSTATTIMLLGILGFLALYHLVLVGLDRREIGALAIVAISLGMFTRFSMTEERLLFTVWPELPFPVYMKILMLVTYALFAAVAHMVRYTFPGIFPNWFMRAVNIFIAGLCLIVLATPPGIYMHTLPLWSAAAAVAGGYATLRIIQAIRRRVPDSGVFLLAFALFLLCTINDMLFALGHIQSEYLSRYGITAFVIFQAFTVSRRILRSRRLSEALAADLEQSNERLRSLDRMKDEFLARTSHELRTPLQGIIGISDSLREDVVPGAAAQKKLDLIQGSGRRLSGLVNDILDFTRMQHGDIQLRRGPINLRAFVDVQLELIAYSHPDRKGVALINDVPAALPEVNADEARLTQVLQNLLDNALRVTTTGSVRVAAELTTGGDQLHIHVLDTGPGIPPGQRDYIFQPFEQGASGAGKSGLGLAIARSIVEMHGGKIWLQSMVEGSCFSFSLPTTNDEPLKTARRGAGSARYLDLLPDILPDRTRRSLPATASDTEPPTTPVNPRSDHVRVLLVDDEAVNLEVMQFYIQQEGWTPIVAASAAEARAILSAGEPPDCVVLDLMMPGVSGLELARELRQRYSLADLPILMVTALSGTGDFVAALDAGANDYLSKPFEKEEFLFRVANLTTLSRTQRAGQRALLEAARRERLRINSDLHDHLGANLTDLKTLSEKALLDPDVPEEFAGRLREQVREIIHIFRNDLLNLEDLDLLEENFFSGINMMLLRRYVEAGRELEFSAPDDSGPVALGPDTSNLAVLATVIKEVVTNDLKYGGGTAYWKFNLDDHRLDIHFRSLSHYHLETHGTGKGTSGMLRRLSAIGGTLRIAIDTSGETSTTRERPIRIQINAPLGQAGTR